jgi:hypothetical protein
VSVRGLSFLHDGPLELGSLVVLRVRGGPDASFRSHSAVVAHATPHQGRWLIGCRVNPAFSDKELASLMSFDDQKR